MAKLTEREEAVIILDTLTNDENGYTHKELLEHIINNYLSGDDALDAMKGCIEEFPSPDFEDEEEDEEDSDETSFDLPVGNVTVNFAMIDINGTDLVEGVEYRLDGKLLGDEAGRSLREINSDNIEELIERFL